MKPALIEPNREGVLIVTCTCDRYLARHVHQIPRYPGFFEVLCVGCRKRRHLFKTEGGEYYHKSVPSEPHNLGGGYEG